MAPNPINFTGFGAIMATKPYKFIGFGAIEATKPYKFIGFGGLPGTRVYTGIHGYTQDPGPALRGAWGSRYPGPKLSTAGFDRALLKGR